MAAVGTTGMRRRVGCSRDAIHDQIGWGPLVINVRPFDPIAQ